MFKSRYMHIVVYCILIASNSLFALTPTQRGPVIKLTEEITGGKLTEQQARERAIGLKIPARGMNDKIVDALILAADKKGFYDLFNPAMLTRSGAPTPVVTPTPMPTSPIAQPTTPEITGVPKQPYISTPMPETPGAVTIEIPTAVVPAKGKFEDMLNQAITAEKAFIERLKTDKNITLEQVNAGEKEIATLINKGKKEFDTLNSTNQLGYKLNQRENELYEQHLKLYGEYNQLVYEKRNQLTQIPTEKPKAPSQLPKEEIDKQFNAILDPLRTEVRDAYAKLDKDIENQLKDKPNVNEVTFRAFDKKRAEIENREHTLQQELANFAKYQPKYIGLESASTKNLAKEILALSDSVYDKLKKLRIILQENIEQLKTTFAQEKAPTTAGTAAKGQYEQELSDIIRQEEGYIAQLQKMVDGTIALDSNILSDKTFNQVMLTPIANFKRKVGPKPTFTEKENDLTQQHPENYQKANKLRIKALEMLHTQQAPTTTAGTAPNVTTTQPQAPTAQGLADFYTKKEYTPQELSKYKNKASKTMGIKLNIGSSESPDKEYYAIKAAIELAVEAFRKGTANEARIQEILLPAYYDVKEYMQDLMQKKDLRGFMEAKHQANNAIYNFLDFAITNNRDLASYIAEFERDVDSGKAPTTTAGTAPNVTTTQPQAPTQPQQTSGNLNNLIDEYTKKKLTDAQFDTFSIIRGEYQDLDDDQLITSIEQRLVYSSPGDIRDLMDRYSTSKEAEKYIKSDSIKQRASQAFKTFLEKTTQPVSLKTRDNSWLNKKDYPNFAHVVKGKLDGKF